MEINEELKYALLHDVREQTNIISNKLSIYGLNGNLDVDAIHRALRKIETTIEKLPILNKC